jgi:glycosyltransferase involved in cell wall biosynthesis
MQSSILMSGKKIVVVPSFYPMDLHYKRGGFFEEQAILIRNTGTDISVVFNENRELNSISIPKIIHAHFQKQFQIESGLPVFRNKAWNIVPTRFNLGKTIWIKQCIRLLKNYIQIFGMPDLLHVQCIYLAGYVAEYFKDRFNIPFIITEHSTVFASRQLSTKETGDALRIYKKASKVIVVSRPFQKLLSQIVGLDINKIDVIPNFIDCDYFSPNIDLSGSVNDKDIIFTVCHHEKKKCLDRLIDAFKLVLIDNPTWKLYIGGNGRETNSLKKRVKDLNLSNYVVFTGFLSKEKVRFYMKKSKIFVLPSDIETFGIVLIEAMSMGLPVVSTRSGGPEDIINEQNGVLVNRTSEELATGIKHVITNYDSFNKCVIRNHALNNFSGERIGSIYNNLYDQTYT